LSRRISFRRRAFPVFDREGVQGQYAKAKTGGRLHGVAHGINAGTVALHPGEVTLGRPTAIAVHDDRDMRRQPFEIYLPRESFIWMPGRNPF
jgi:hypothetical protein